MREILRKKGRRLVLFVALSGLCLQGTSQNSVAHEWIEVNLEAIRKDISRPTVHARNLWYTSIAMYDCWAAYDSIAKPYFLGDSLGTYTAEFLGIPEPTDIQTAREEAISFAAYRMIRHRYSAPPSQSNTYFICDTTMAYLGYDPSFTSTDYSTGIPAALGNYVAEQLIAAGLVDGANELNNYANQYYEPVNTPLNIDAPHFIGNPDMDSLNRWQPLELTLFCDQGGNPFTIAPEFTSPEWGDVIPFSMDSGDVNVKSRDGSDWNIYHDPGEPPHIGLEGDLQTEDYRWGFELVAKWSGQLDPADTTTMDISPASIGNLSIDDLPQDISEYPDFYDLENGGDASTGHPLNPKTGMPYTPQIVKRGDYARILAEYWADGPDSETPPGHWFSIYNEISQGPEFTWLWNGVDSLDHLEYDVKTYFTMGGAMHDAAVASWSIKGFYDYPRPVSAIRAMAELGQSTSDTLPNYHPAGLGLDAGHIEFVQLGDTLFDGDTIYIAGPDEVNELKLYCWAGPLAEDTCITGFAPDYQTDVAGTTWKLAKDWWPYQRPTFVSPPFAGYISGHSTFSRAAAEIMTLTTGDAFFPGGMGEFECPQNNFLVFEEGPSVDITLQWATYRDASDQTSLSRIWGGIHPPCDDIPGRKIGYEIGHDAFALAEEYFGGGVPFLESVVISDESINDSDVNGTLTILLEYSQAMDTLAPMITFSQDLNSCLAMQTDSWPSDSTYQVVYDILDSDQDFGLLSLMVDSAYNRGGNIQTPFGVDSLLFIDQENPTALLSLDASSDQFLLFDLTFSEPMDTLTDPAFDFPVESPLGNVMNLNDGLSGWNGTTEYQVRYDIIPSTQLHDIDLSISFATDSLGNEMVVISESDYFSVDGVAPLVVEMVPSLDAVTENEAGDDMMALWVMFNERMNTDQMPLLAFTTDDPTVNTLTLDSLSSNWQGDSTFVFVFDVVDADEEFYSIDLTISEASDLEGNALVLTEIAGAFVIDMIAPTVLTVIPSIDVISNGDVGTETFGITLSFSEPIDQSEPPLIGFPVEDPSSSILLNATASEWLFPTVFSSAYDVEAGAQSLADIDISVSGATDTLGNQLTLVSFDDVFSIDIVSSLSEIENAVDFTLSPNPTSDLIVVRTNDGIDIDRIELTNNLGQVVMFDQPRTHAWTGDLSLLPQGIYQVRITNERGSGIKQIIVK